MMNPSSSFQSLRTGWWFSWENPLSVNSGILSISEVSRRRHFCGKNLHSTSFIPSRCSATIRGLQSSTRFSVKCWTMESSMTSFSENILKNPLKKFLLLCWPWTTLQSDSLLASFLWCSASFYSSLNFRAARGAPWKKLSLALFFSKASIKWNSRAWGTACQRNPFYKSVRKTFPMCMSNQS